MVDSSDLALVLSEADDIAQSVSQKPTTAHAVLALFTVDNPGQRLLKERGVDEDRLLALVKSAPTEPDGTLRELRERAREIARACGSREADCLHLLIAVTRLRCAGHELLAGTGLDLTAVRNTALSYFLSGRMPRKFGPRDARSPARRITTGAGGLGRRGAGRLPPGPRTRPGPGAPGRHPCRGAALGAGSGHLPAPGPAGAEPHRAGPRGRAGSGRRSLAGDGGGPRRPRQAPHQQPLPRRRARRGEDGGGGGRRAAAPVGAGGAGEEGGRRAVDGRPPRWHVTQGLALRAAQRSPGGDATRRGPSGGLPRRDPPPGGRRVDRRG